MAENAIEITNDSFEAEVMKSDLPVLLDFWAPWCGPCRFIAPAVEEVAKTYEGKVKVGKVNVDEAGEIAAKYSITSIPTLLVIKDGEIVDRKVGAVPQQAIEDMVKPLV